MMIEDSKKLREALRLFNECEQPALMAAFADVVCAKVLGGYVECLENYYGVNCRHLERPINEDDEDDDAVAMCWVGTQFRQQLCRELAGEIDERFATTNPWLR